MTHYAKKEAKIKHAPGLHLRTASLLVQCAGKFQSRITISGNGRNAEACSILNILGLGAEKGSKVIIEAEGEDAGLAVEALGELLETEHKQGSEQDE